MPAPRKRTARPEKSPSSDPADLKNKSPPRHSSDSSRPSSSSPSKKRKTRSTLPPSLPQPTPSLPVPYVPASRSRSRRRVATPADPPYRFFDNLPVELLTIIIFMAASCPNPERNVEQRETAEKAVMRSYQYQQASYRAMALVCQGWAPIARRGLFEAVLLGGNIDSESVLARLQELKPREPTTKVVVNWHGKVYRVTILHLLSIFQPPEILELKLRRLSTTVPMSLPLLQTDFAARLTVLVIELNLGEMVDLAPGATVQFSLKSFKLRVSMMQQTFANLIRAILAKNTVEHLEIDYPRSFHSDDLAWRQYLPAVTTLKSVVFSGEIPASIPSILAYAPDLLSVDFHYCPHVAVLKSLLFAPDRKAASLATLRIMSSPFPYTHPPELVVVEALGVPDVMGALASAIREGEAARELKSVEVWTRLDKTLPIASATATPIEVKATVLPWKAKGWVELKALEVEERITIFEKDV